MMFEKIAMVYSKNHTRYRCVGKMAGGAVNAAISGKLC
jgi:hypothetical protein